MTVYIVRRLCYAVLTFFGITVATFALIRSVPGDPVSFYIGRAGAHTVPAETLAAIRAEFHLDEPLPSQYLHWLRNAVTLDFGRSIVDRRPVRERIAEKLPNTFQLNFIAFLIAVLSGVPIGLWSARRAGRAGEKLSSIALFLLYSLPSFWVALLLMQFFAVRWNLLPLLGMTSHDYSEMNGAAQIGDRLRHLVLPVATLTYAQLAIFARFSKSAFSEVIRQDFITAARAKGTGPGALMWRHAFRNALMPLITLLGLTVPYLISGSVIVEQMFQWDGIGLLYFDSILARDYPTVMALTVVTAIVTLLASVAADVLYAVADPRVRVGERR
jgi:peptide/nickel transport system permease protein